MIVCLYIWGGGGVNGAMHRSNGGLNRFDVNSGLALRLDICHAVKKGPDRERVTAHCWAPLSVEVGVTSSSFRRHCFGGWQLVPTPPSHPLGSERGRNPHIPWGQRGCASTLPVAIFRAPVTSKASLDEGSTFVKCSSDVAFMSKSAEIFIFPALGNVSTTKEPYCTVTALPTVPEPVRLADTACARQQTGVRGPILKLPRSWRLVDMQTVHHPVTVHLACLGPYWGSLA